MKKRIYHVAFLKGSGKTAWGGNRHRKDTVILQAREDMDCLSCEMWKYFGKTELSKKEMRGRKSEILDAVNLVFKTNFTRLIVD